MCGPRSQERRKKRLSCEIKSVTLCSTFFFISTLTRAIGSDRTMIFILEIKNDFGRVNDDSQMAWLIRGPLECVVPERLPFKKSCNSPIFFVGLYDSDFLGPMV